MLGRRAVKRPDSSPASRQTKHDDSLSIPPYMIRFIEAPVSSSRCLGSGDRNARRSWEGPDSGQAEISALKGGKIRRRNALFLGVASRRVEETSIVEIIPFCCASRPCRAPGPPSNSARARGFQATSTLSTSLHYPLASRLLLLHPRSLLPKSFLLYSALTSGRTASAYWRACRQLRRALPACRPGHCPPGESHMTSLCSALPLAEPCCPDRFVVPP